MVVIQSMVVVVMTLFMGMTELTIYLGAMAMISLMAVKEMIIYSAKMVTIYC